MLVFASMSTVTTSVPKVVLPKFNVRSEDRFSMWWAQFIAYARLHKFNTGDGHQEGLLLNPTSNTETLIKAIDPETTDQALKDALEAYKCNAMAFACLMMALTGDAALSYVAKGYTTNWSSRVACFIIKELFDKFQPNDYMRMAELRMTLNTVSMKKKDGPTILFGELKKI